MNCTTCGNALPAGGGLCTICNPWLTPTTDRAAAPVGMPEGVIPKRAMRAVNRYPAGAVDMDAAFRRSSIAIIVTAIGYFLAGLFDIVESGSRGLTGQPSYFVAVGPLVVGILINAAILKKSGGWYGAAISNLKVRPDIGLPWRYSLPEIKRLNFAGLYLTVPFGVFIFFRVTNHPGTYAALQGWVVVSGAVYLMMGIAQVVIFAVFAKPVFLAVRARLAVPPPWAVPAPQGSVAPGATA